MQTSLDTIKEDIYDKVSEIKDERVLKAIKTLIDNLYHSLDEEVTETIDLNYYIKEWVKSID